MKICMPINPMNEKWCGVKCPQSMNSHYGTVAYCRLFSESFGDRRDGLRLDEQGCIVRHPKCIEFEMKGME